jgi:hypothetical protein
MLYANIVLLNAKSHMIQFVHKCLESVFDKCFLGFVEGIGRSPNQTLCWLGTQPILPALILLLLSPDSKLSFYHGSESLARKATNTGLLEIPQSDLQNHIKNRLIGPCEMEMKHGGL